MNKHLLLLFTITSALRLGATSDSPTDSPRSPKDESTLSGVGYSPTLPPRMGRSDSDSDSSDSQRRESKVLRSKSLTIEAEGTVELDPAWGINTTESDSFAGRASPFYGNRSVFFTGIKRFKNLTTEEKQALLNHFAISDGDDTLVVPIKLKIEECKKPAPAEGASNIDGIKQCASRKIQTDFSYLPLNVVHYENAKLTADGKDLYLPPMLFEDYLTVDDNGSGPRQTHLNVRLRLKSYKLTIDGKPYRELFSAVLGNMIESYNQGAKEAAEKNAQTVHRASMLRIISAKNLNEID